MKKFRSYSIALLSISLAAFTACSGNNSKKIEAEKFEVHGGKIMAEENGFSGRGYINFASHINGFVEIPVNVKKDGDYAIKITFKNSIHDDWAGLRLEYDEGKYICSQRLPETSSFSSVYINAAVTFTKGKHTLKVISVNRSWLLDSIELVPLTEEILEQISPAKLPVSKNAGSASRALYKYLLSQRGKAIISGQQYSSMLDVDVIEEETGKVPAILGIDMMDYSPSRVEHGARGTVVRRAKAWVKTGGLITCCWHWNAPAQLIDENKAEMHWYDGFRSKATKFDFSKAIKDKNSEEYSLIIRDIDAIAVQLKALQDADIPILWRPLHEASGGWFWWGSKGAENYKELYKILFDRLENYHQLNNLIWVWNGQNPDWYPGDEYVDVVSYDTYPGKQIYGSFYNELQTVQTASTMPKLCALSENGPIPDVEKIIEEKLPWSWFCTWCGEFVQKDGAYSGEYTDAETLKKFYNSEYLISRDEVKFKRK